MPETGDIACDHYHRWREDVALMAELGVTAYCFSIAWTRVIPDGDGAINPAGLGFYERLIDELLVHGIAPWPTLFHWELPQALQDRGGWASRRTVDAFARYTDVVSTALGDRAKHWVTHNEPWVAAFLGHLEGAFAPGIRDWRTALGAAHHLLLSHGRAVQTIRSNVPTAVVGIASIAGPADRRARRLATSRPSGTSTDFATGGSSIRSLSRLPGRHGRRLSGTGPDRCVRTDIRRARRHGDDRAAARLPWAQLLHEPRDRGRTRRERGHRCASERRSAGRSHRNGMADHAECPDRLPAAPLRGVSTGAHHRHRERGELFHRAGTRWSHPRPTPHRLPPTTHRGSARRGPKRASR